MEAFLAEHVSMKAEVERLTALVANQAAELARAHSLLATHQRARVAYEARNPDKVRAWRDADNARARQRRAAAKAAAAAAFTEDAQ